MPKIVINKDLLSWLADPSMPLNKRKNALEALQQMVLRGEPSGKKITVEGPAKGWRRTNVGGGKTGMQSYLYWLPSTIIENIQNVKNKDSAQKETVYVRAVRHHDETSKPLVLNLDQSLWTEITPDLLSGIEDLLGVVETKRVGSKITRWGQTSEESHTKPKSHTEPKRKSKAEVNWQKPTTYVSKPIKPKRYHALPIMKGHPPTKHRSKLTNLRPGLPSQNKTKTIPLPVQDAFLDLLTKSSTKQVAKALGLRNISTWISGRDTIPEKYWTQIESLRNNPPPRGEWRGKTPKTPTRPFYRNVKPRIRPDYVSPKTAIQKTRNALVVLMSNTPGKEIAEKLGVEPIRVSDWAIGKRTNTIDFKRSINKIMTLAGKPPIVISERKVSTKKAFPPPAPEYPAVESAARVEAYPKVV